MKKKTILFLTGACLIVWSLFFIEPVHAQLQAGSGMIEQMQGAGDASGLDGKTDPRLMVARVIQIILSLTGMIFTFLILQAGYWFMIARGREDYIEKAKKTMLRATIGLILVVSAYSITTFVKNGITHISDASETR